MAPSSAQPDGQPESAGHDLPTNPDGTLDLSRMTNEDIAGQMHYAALDIAHSAQSGDADAYGRSIRDFFMERDELLGRIRQMPWGLGRVLAERQYGKAISSAYESCGHTGAARNSLDKKAVRGDSSNRCSPSISGSSYS